MYSAACKMYNRHCLIKEAAGHVLIFILLIQETLVNVRSGFRCGLRGATVARLTPDQKVACSNHVGVNSSLLLDIPFAIFLQNL